MAENERIEYIRKSERIARKENGKIKCNKGRDKKGVMYCGVNPLNPDSVEIGFSVCSSLDQFDYINGVKEEGFGINLAKTRASKWAKHEDYFIQNSFTENDIYDFQNRKINLFRKINPNTKTVVEIPPSIFNRFKKFIERCKKYYKDKEFPQWVNNIVENNYLEVPEEEFTLMEDY